MAIPVASGGLKWSKVVESGSGGSAGGAPGPGVRRAPLYGSKPAKIDDKGRLKVPAEFRSAILETYGAVLFVTKSLVSESASIYPMAVWEEIEARIMRLPRTNRYRQKLVRRTSYFGQKAEFDQQGRVLIPGRLRENVPLVGEVEVTTSLDHLEVSELDSFRKLAEEPWTDEDRDASDEI